MDISRIRGAGAARRMVEETKQPMKRIASVAGFGDTNTLVLLAPARRDTSRLPPPVLLFRSYRSRMSYGHSRQVKPPDRAVRYRRISTATAVEEESTRKPTMTSTLPVH